MGCGSSDAEDAEGLDIGGGDEGGDNEGDDGEGSEGEEESEGSGNDKKKDKKKKPKKDKFEIKRSTRSETEMKFKILTLGAGECGKTTIWRQLKIIYCGGFNNNDKKALKFSLRANVLSDIQELIKAAKNGFASIPDEINDDAENLLRLDPSTRDDFNMEAAEIIKKVWNDPVIKRVYGEANSIGIGENADYFLDNVMRLAEEEYLPTDKDILKARVRTTGINNNMLFEIKDIPTLLVDVGGQKSERKNWNTCFQNVSFVMFVVSLSDFDQNMFEENEKSRTADSIELFGTIASNEIFAKTPFILVLNKFDIFKKKLKANPEAFKKAYPGFSGNVGNVNECLEHVKKAFTTELDNKRGTGSEVYVVHTCAMADVSVRKLFQEIGGLVVKKNEAEGVEP